MRGHCTAEMTGQLAKQLQAKVCVLNHLTVHDTPTMLNKLSRVKAASKGSVGQVLSAFDFMELVVPPGGFDFS